MALADNKEKIRTLLNGINNLPDAGGGVSVQPDWNQNDSTQPDYIRNRPFYSEGVMTEIMPETEIVGEDDGSGTFVYAGLPVVEEAGNATITFDGTKYNLSPVEGEEGIFAYGNIDLGSGVSDIPFVLMVMPGTLSAIAMLDGDAHTVSITMEVPQNKIIDENYLPAANVFYVKLAEYTGDEGVIKYVYTDKKCLRKATSIDVIEAMESNTEIILKVQNIVDLGGVVLDGTVLRIGVLFVNCIDADDENAAEIIAYGHGGTIKLYTAEYTS